MYEDNIIIIKQLVEKILKENDKLYLWLDHLENSSADLHAWKTTFYYISVMVKQLENGYKDTALEIAGKCIIKSGYCMLLKSNYIFQFFFDAILPPPPPPPPPPPHTHTHNIINRSHCQYLVDFILFSTKHV